MSDGHVDVFSGPAVPAAIADALSVEPGRLRVTAFTAWDTGELIGLNGRSLIIRLPEDAPENNRPYWGRQWYVSGKTVGTTEYSPEWCDWVVEKTRCWLLDLGIMNNWFAEKPDREAVLFQRLKSLDTGNWIRSGGLRLRPPAGYLDDDSHMFTFDVPLDLDVHIGKDVPVGIWHAHIKGGRVVPGILERAHEAPFACVCFLRFQKENPGARKDRTA